MPLVRLRPGEIKRPKRFAIGEDIVIGEKNHEKLLDHCIQTLEAFRTLRDMDVERLREIDREVNGYLVRDVEDKEREVDNRLGRGNKPVDEKLPLTFAQLDECMTFMATVLAPDEGIYTAIAPKQYQSVAKGFSRLMNEHAEKYGHYLALLRMIFDGLKYNQGAVSPCWKQLVGNRVQRGPGNSVSVTNDVVYAGNELIPIDMYNLVYDYSVPLHKVNTEGLFFATIEMRNSWHFEKAEADGQIWRADRFINETGRDHYYKQRPVIGAQTRESRGITDWFQILGERASQLPAGQDNRIFEKVIMHKWIKPSEYALSDSKDYEIWRFVIANQKYVIQATHLNNAHAMLPLCATRPITDGFEWQTRSFGDLLTPMNRFASHEMNVHQRAQRKALIGGLTIYNANVLPLMGQDDVDLAGGKVPANTTSQDVDLRRHIVQLSERPDTQNVATNIEMATQIMQQILPTDQARQVAGLERATQYQAAAMVQSAHRRNLMYAKIMNFQAMVPCRHMQMMNIFQYQDRVEIINPDTGQLDVIDPTEFTDANLEFKVADGLRGLDRTALILHSRETLNSLLQSNQAQNIDVVSLINYITTLWGDDTDWSQFRFESPIDALSPEQKQLAWQLLQRFIAEQQGGGAPEGEAGAGQPPTLTTVGG